MRTDFKYFENRHQVIYKIKSLHQGAKDLECKEYLGFGETSSENCICLL